MIMDKLMIVCFGDSITFGYCAEYGKDYVSLFKAKVKEDFPDREIIIRNRGANGESSRNGLRRIDSELDFYKPDLVIMLFGSNDSAYSDYYHVGLEEFSYNYDKIIGKTLESGSRMALITPTPVIEEDPPFVENSVLEKYCAVVREKAEKYGLPLIDMYSVFNEAGRDDLSPLLQWDGEHISAKGYEVFFDAVYRTVKPIIEELMK